MKEKVLILGGGFMGIALAKYLNRYNIKTFLFDTDPTVISRHKKNKELNSVKFLNDIEDAFNIDIIIETVPERLYMKQDLFAKIESMFDAPTVFCTNTSSFLISEIGSRMRNKSRLIGTHFFSPADITPLVEVIPSSYTFPVYLENILLFLKKIEKNQYY
ncbi:3-hydroxyacyl-CoA dehydrogenase NAD-binding domain-containing protein [Pseudogracilibacillus sp. SO30301A]|uniref:3-hydroxyacyl-CoA dehydrogenase NAD-binding domain-containing protein n=1 Tax=Pseudogracilibacillus sp. SO30301A TaxID=3098291 RepID=UPI00300DFFAD